MAKLLGVRGSLPASRLIKAGSRSIRTPYGTLPEPVFYARLADSLETTNGTGTFTRAGVEASYRGSNGLIQFAAANTPRYQDGGIIVEPEGTNQVAENTEISGSAPYDVPFYGSRAVQSVTAPDGSTDASEFWCNDDFGGSSAGSQFSQRMTAAADFVAGESVTVSCYLKALGSSPNPWARFTFRDRAGNNTFQYFNMSTGQVGSASGVSPVSHTDVEGPDAAGWYRFSFTTVNVGSSDVPLVTVTQSSVDGALTPIESSQGNGMAAWGFQVETNQAYPSTLIKNTTGAKITRQQDEPILPGMPSGYNRDLGALSIKVQALTQFDRLPLEARLIWGASGNTSYLLMGTDGSTIDNYQSNPGSGGNSFVSRQQATASDSICVTFDASGKAAFPGTKRFMYINGTKWERQNGLATDDSFVAWDEETENRLGQSFLGTSIPAVPCIISHVTWWPELTESQATKVSLR